MEGCPIEGERVPPRPLTKEAVMSLNDYSVTFEHASAMFGVDLPTFKAKLLEFDIFVWKAPHGLRYRIHGGPYTIHIVINNVRSHYVVRGTLSFSDVVSKIERSLLLRPKSYELTYKDSHTSVYHSLNTDRDWHNAVEPSSRRRSHYVSLNLKTEVPHIVSLIANYDKYDYDYEDPSDCAFNGNVEIGNGYGSLTPLTILSGANSNEKHELGKNISELQSEDAPAKDNIVAFDNDASNKDVYDNDDDADASGLSF